MLRYINMNKTANNIVQSIKNDKFAIVIFMLISIININLPGLYMDSVNPDYLAVYLKKPQFTPAWIYNDNFLAPDYRIPLLNSLYGGATPAYIGCLFWKVVGYNIFSVRILHVLYGMLLLYLFYKIIMKVTKKPSLASFCTILLAVEPTYVFAWRTQYYLQLFPLITFIPALYLISKELTDIYSNGTWDKKRIAISAMLFGFSAWGYFIFTIYSASIFVMLLYVLIKKNIEKIKPLFIFCVNFLVGYSLFIYAHLSIIINEGFANYIKVVTSLNKAYSISDGNNVSFIEKVNHTTSLLAGLTGGNNISKVVFGNENLNNLGILVGVILGILIIVSITLDYIYNDNLKTEIKLMKKMIFFIILIHTVFGIAIGNSLQFQHYVMILVLLYIGGTLSALEIYNLYKNNILKINPHNFLIKFLFPILAIFFICINMLGVIKINQELEKTGGKGSYSDVINSIGEYIYALPNNTVIAFPQWGYWMGASLLTGGTKELWSTQNVDEFISKFNSKTPHMKEFYIVLEPEKSDVEIEKIVQQLNYTLKDKIIFKSKDGSKEVFLCYFSIN